MDVATTSKLVQAMVLSNFMAPPEVELSRAVT